MEDNTYGPLKPLLIFFFSQHLDAPYVGPVFLQLLFSFHFSVLFGTIIFNLPNQGQPFTMTPALAGLMPHFNINSFSVSWESAFKRAREKAWAQDTAFSSCNQWQSGYWPCKHIVFVCVRVCYQLFSKIVKQCENCAYIFLCVCVDGAKMQECNKCLCRSKTCHMWWCNTENKSLMASSVTYRV